MKLVWRYSLTLLSVLATVILVMLAIQLWQLDRSTRAMKALAESSLQVQLDEQLKTRGSSMAEVLAENVATPYLAYDMAAIYDLLLPVRRSEAVRAVYVFDLNGKIIHDATKDIVTYGEPIVRQAPDVLVGAQDAQLLTRGDSFAIVAPVIAGSDLIAGVFIELSRNGVTQPIALMQRRYDEIVVEQRAANLTATGLSALVLAAIGLLLTFIAARRMARPILDLVRHTKSVAQGNYDVQVEIERRDELGELANAFVDMSAQINAKSEHIAYLAYHDRLTGLPNRAAFADALQARFDAEIASSDPTPGAVLFVDLDDFKRINDTLSHEAGDQLLCKLGERIKQVIERMGFPELALERRSIIPVARWGGDEFTIYLDGVGSQPEASGYVQKILETLAAPFLIAGLEISVRASVGASFFPHDDHRVKTLLNYADVAMYRSKEHGSPGGQAYSQALTSITDGRLPLQSSLRAAIDNGELQIRYQPIFDPNSESLHGLEAQLCWLHPDQGLLYADAFMAVAESSGLAADIAAWLVASALREFGSWQHARDADLELTINLSGGQLDADNLVEILAAGIEESGIDSGRVILEITETGLFHNVLQAAQLLHDIRALGVQTWIDAFGSGYSSINRLRRLPLDGLKIDATLISSLEDPGDQNLVGAVISLAHSLGLRAGAEGVSNRAQLDFLRRNGCDTVQGSRFGSPMDGESTGDYLRSARPGVATPVAAG